MWISETLLPAIAGQNTHPKVWDVGHLPGGLHSLDLHHLHLTGALPLYQSPFNLWQQRQRCHSNGANKDLLCQGAFWLLSRHPAFCLGLASAWTCSPAPDVHPPLAQMSDSRVTNITSFRGELAGGMILIQSLVGNCLGGALRAQMACSPSSPVQPCGIRDIQYHPGRGLETEPLHETGPGRPQRISPGRDGLDPEMPAGRPTGFPAPLTIVRQRINYRHLFLLVSAPFRALRSGEDGRQIRDLGIFLPKSQTLDVKCRPGVFQTLWCPLLSVGICLVGVSRGQLSWGATNRRFGRPVANSGDLPHPSSSLCI